ncbi:Clavaminate synthase-like protein [Peniophora sp. CONT]|nr:Clavaminate synthase-like protein [Peniophora sp. CONT]
MASVVASASAEQAPIAYTPEGAVAISYRALVSSPMSLTASIEKAFGSSPDSLGIVVVRDLPPAYPQLRKELLGLANAFASLPEGTRENYADAASKYSFGWSHGKEVMNGKPDLLKGSYYANPVLDTPDVSATLKATYPEYYSSNIWPRDEPAIANFEAAFKGLGRFVFDVGCSLANACQPFAAAHLTDKNFALADFIRQSQTTKARLLHYFPTPPSATPEADEPVDSWCGFHKDHSLLTGLVSAMYLRHTSGAQPEVVSAPSSSAGLYIRSRGGSLTKVVIPPDALAFQTGEALELATEGRLRATPHCVRGGASPDGTPVSRETFALFMQPDVEARVSADETYGQFSRRIFEEHYPEEAKA